MKNKTARQIISERVDELGSILFNLKQKKEKAAAEYEMKKATGENPINLEYDYFYDIRTVQDLLTFNESILKFLTRPTLVKA